MQLTAIAGGDKEAQEHMPGKTSSLFMIIADDWPRTLGLGVGYRERNSFFSSVTERTRLVPEKRRRARVLVSGRPRSDSQKPGML